MKTEFERYYWICDAPGCYFVREHGVNFHLAKCTTQHTAEMIVNALYSDQQNKELRELLGKCRDSLSGTVVNLGFDSPMDHQIAEQLIDDIDNELNPP